MKKFLYVSVFTFFTFVLIFAWSQKPRYELENNITRLHIIANSNSPEDQQLKLKIRDEILELAKRDGSSPGSAAMERTANEILRKNGVSYGARAVTGKFNITRRSYENFILPEGKYTAARIELGKAQGENWWCVLTPPLCFTDSVFGKTENLSSYLSHDTNNIINGDINIKFKTLEIASKIAEKLGI